MAAVNPIEELASAIIRGIGVGIDVIGGVNEFNLLQYEKISDITSKPTYNNECIFWMDGLPGKEDTTFVNVDLWLKCQDQASLLGSWNNPGIGDTLAVSDARVGDLSITFQKPVTSEYPWPGEIIIHNPAWTQEGGDGTGLKECIEGSEKGSIETKDCNDDKTVVTVCTEGFSDGTEGVINDENIVAHGWTIVMAVPEVGVNPVCPSSKAKVKRTLSRFQIE
ncbi:hypothetical protein BDV96DRAFT_692672 [Lophiotrema nucula]|uniref:Uncharacterized protein n=1 Tax=Lophiotrema nucula TaxID=690887 RepID=A0A6A5YNJ6_9PLEO|nr:hypothetical protein BDV96DRAFT_692672 [Lophiotrema nucula]